jgi:hypothetical protein
MATASRSFCPSGALGGGSPRLRAARRGLHLPPGVLLEPLARHRQLNLADVPDTAAPCVVSQPLRGGPMLRRWPLDQLRQQPEQQLAVLHCPGPNPQFVLLSAARAYTKTP